MIELSQETEQSQMLIVLTGSMGDIVRGGVVPVLVKSQTPHAKISWLVEEKWRDLVSLNESVDRIFTFDKRRPLKSILKVKRELRGSGETTVLDMQRILKSGLMSLASGAKTRIGVHRKNSKECNWLFSNKQNNFVPDNVSKVYLYLEFLRTLEYEIPDQIDFGIKVDRIRSDIAQRYAALNSPFIVIVLGSSWNSKDWVFEGYYGLIKKLLHEYQSKIVLVGDSAQKRTATKLIENISHERLFSLVGETSIMDLAFLCSNCQVGIGPDSGPAHLTSAMGRPYITLFGPTDPERVAAWGSLDLVCRSEIACSPCLRRECPGLNRLCMRLIQPEQVLEKIGRVLSR